MFKHYFASTLRHFAKHKTTTAINVLCLTLGLVCFAIAYGIVEYYRNADRYHEKADRTYVITQANKQVDAATASVTAPFSGWSVAPLLKTDYPDLEIVARAMLSQEVALATEGEKAHALVFYADPEYLEVFDLPFLSGDHRAALRAPRSAVIREELARTLFGNGNAIGKTLLLNNRETVHITGVIAAPKSPTHIAAKFATKIVDFALLVSMDTAEALRTGASPALALTNDRSFDPSVFTYLVFKKDSSLTPNEVRADLARFSERHVPADRTQIELTLRPVSQVLEVMADVVVGASKTGVTNRTMCLIMGALVLAAACLSYANIASAQAATRLKELALRRVVGASHRQILLQSFFEAGFLVVIAAILALALLVPTVKSLGKSTGLELASVLYTSTSFWLWTVATLVVVTVLASSYPAIVAAQIRPANALQQGRSPNTKRLAMYLLVIAQFASASFLFIATSVMHAQNERMRPAQVSGTESIAVLTNNFNEAGIDRQLLQTELRRQSAIAQVSATDTLPGETLNFKGSTVLSGAEPNSRRWRILTSTIDYDFFATVQVRLLAGRVFDRDTASDLSTTTNTGNVVIDRAMAEQYGWSNPQDAIGKSIYQASSALKGAVGIPRTVIGVVENSGLIPMVMIGSAATVYSLNPERASILLVRFANEDAANGARAIATVWNAIAPNIPLKRRFISEQFEETYKMIDSMLMMFRTLAFMSLVVGALGLVGIATHAINQRRFEIGVRRTLGASIRQVLVMLLKDFGKPILLANVIAWPFAFVVANAFTSLFVDRVPLTVLPFIGSLLLGLVIAWLAILKQATSAARMNPAMVLRHE